MNTTFALELSKSKALPNQGSILIRCTQNRKHKRIATGITLKVKDWDKFSQKVKKQNPLYQEYNKILQDKLKNVLSLYSKLIENNAEPSLGDILRGISNTVTGNFFEFAERTKLAQISASNKLGTFRRYETALAKFKSYAGDCLSINQVTYSLLQKYELYLLKELGNSRDTVSSNLSVLRVVINEAIRHDLYKSRNPFDQIHLKYTDQTKEKLTVEELRDLFKKPIPSIPSFILAKDFFLACFLAEGTRGGDMVTMKKENIVNGCLVFNQQKTGKKMVIPIVPALQQIFDSHVSFSEYLFPLLSGESVVNEIVINSKLTYINKYLKEVAKYCGIFKKLSTHVARHTYTDLALQVSNENIYQVQQSLGHSSVKTTEIYSRQRVNYNKPSLLTDVMSIIENE